MKKLRSIFSIFTVIFLAGCSNDTDQPGAFLKATQAFGDSATVYTDATPAPLQAVSLKDSFVIPAAQGFDAHAALAENGNPDFYHWGGFDEVYEKITITSPEGKQNLSVYELTKSASIATVIAATYAKPMTISQFATALVYMASKQPTGQDGTLFTNGYGNIFYVEISPGQSVAVYAHWNSLASEWGLYAHPLANEWRAGYQVFLRNGSGI